MSFDPGSLSADDHEKFHRFIDKVQAAMEEVFDIENDQPVVVIGAQFGDMGKEEGLPSVLVSANLPPCLVSDAIKEMFEFSEAQHAAYHGGHEVLGDNYVTQQMDLANVPEEVIAELKKMFGDDLDLSQVVFTEAVDISDLTDADETEEPERA